MFISLATSKKKTEPARSEQIQKGQQQQQAILDTLTTLDPERVYLNRDEFTALLLEGIKDRGEKVGIAALRKIVAELGTKNPDADICVNTNGKPEPDSDLRDTEQIPFHEDVEAYFQREVIPYSPDAWIDHDKTRYFYKYEELGDPIETLAEIQTLSASIQADIVKLFSKQVSS